MNGRRGWLSVRLSLRLGRRRLLLQFPPERRGWLIALAVVMLLVGYVVGAVPTVMVLERSGLTAPYRDMVVHTVYAPLIWLSDHVPLCGWFFEAEQDFLEWLFPG
ncbi:MAG: hypothetical protein AABP62_27170 [Planctomycetota bacterium]